MKRRGGFGTRDRVWRARAAWRTLRGLRTVVWQGIVGDYDGNLDWIGREEYRRYCPHPVSERGGGTAGFIDCTLCGATLCARGRWNVWPVEEPAACTCGYEYRRAVWAEHGAGPEGGFLGPDGERGWARPQHYEECPMTWLGPDWRPHPSFAGVL